MKRERRDKKALSEMLSYVLLIVIALGIAAGVYAWIKFYTPNFDDKNQCTEDVSIALKDYNCTVEGILTLKLENNGYFNMDGIIVRASDNSSVLPILNLNSVTPGDCLASAIEGRHYFCSSFNPGNSTVVEFNYISGMPSIKRIQIQPFLVGTKKLILCKNVIDISIEGC